jgi:hypothetical protein
MSDRKYRQRGYQDDDRPTRSQAARDSTPREFRAPSMPGFTSVVRCTRCGHRVAATVGPTSTCEGCGADLHSCAQCTWFDSSKRFECGKPVPARVTPKDARNACDLFQARVRVERETGSPSVSNARDAFDDLFK